MFLYMILDVYLWNNHMYTWKPCRQIAMLAAPFCPLSSTKKLHLAKLIMQCICHPLNDLMQEKVDCEKENSVDQCKEGKIHGSEDNVLENEDYIYTQSLP